MKISKGKLVGLIIIVLLAAVMAAFLCYASEYYHAAQEAQDLRFSEGPVQIKDIDPGLLLDGPGTDTALIFYPGAKVEYVAYLPLLHRLAEDGIDVFLVKMPANLAIFGKKKADAIISANSYSRWYLGGHSLGGAVAAMYAADTENPPDGLILLAAYPTKPLPDISVLELYGSEDTILNQKKLTEGEQYLPSGAVVMEIPGGNHAQFGNYGEQDGDGEATIPALVQQDVTIQMIEALLNSAA